MSIEVMILGLSEKVGLNNICLKLIPGPLSFGSYKNHISFGNLALSSDSFFLNLVLICFHLRLILGQNLGYNFLISLKIIKSCLLFLKILLMFPHYSQNALLLDIFPFNKKLILFYKCYYSIIIINFNPKSSILGLFSIIRSNNQHLLL